MDGRYQLATANTDNLIYRTGTQSLKLAPATTTPTITTAKLALTGPLSNDPAFTELYIRPAATSAANPDACINVDGSCLGFFQKWGDGGDLRL